MSELRSHRLVTSSEAAEALGCTVQHLRLLIRTDKLAAEKQGRDWVVGQKSLEDYASRYKAERQALKISKEQRALFESAEFEPVVNVSSVPQRSPFRYPGGKTWLIPIARQWLKSLSLQPKLLVEPFAGGGGIGLMAAFEGYAQKSLLVELDPSVASVWRTMLGDDSIRLQDRIAQFLCVEEEVRKALAVPPENTIDLAFQTILRNRVSRGGILAPGAGLVKKGEANKGIASRWYPETLVRRIAAIHEQRNKIAFHQADGLDTMCDYGRKPHTAFFIDPPYPVAGKRLYTFYDLDHRLLFARMAALTGPFLATYDHNPTIQALAEEFGFSWKLIPMKSTHHMKKFELLISRDLSWLASEELSRETDAVHQVSL